MPRARLKSLLALVLSTALVACTPTVNPASGQRESTILTPTAEARMGASEHPKIMAQFGGAYADPRVAAYVSELGNRLVDVSEMQGTPFTFTVLDTPTPNAFALPGGYVYVTRGLLALAEDEAELAGVLAHEIGHVTARHAAQRYDRAVAGQIGATVATILGAVLLGDTGAQLGQQASAAAVGAYVQGFSREQEFEADELGVRYLARAGYDPMAMASFLATLQENDRVERQLAGRNPDAETFSMYASHPRTVDRVARAASAAGVSAGGRRDADTYLRVIDGLRYGDDPSQGFVQGDWFVHPELRFRFRLPPSFEVRNQPDAVYGRDAAGLAMVFDAEALPPGADLIRAARTSLGRGLVLDQASGRQINGLPAAIAGDEVVIDGRQGEAAVALIRADGTRVYRFVFLDAAPFSPEDRNRILGTVDSFERLSADEAARYRGNRLRIVRVEPGDTVRSLAGRMAVSRLPEEVFRLLNGLAPGEEVRPGQQVKLVVAA